MGIKTKIIFLIISLTMVVTTSLTLLFLNYLNKTMQNDINTSHKIVLSIKKDELVNKIDLAFHIVEMYYQKSTPAYMKSVVEKKLISKQNMLFSQLNGVYKKYKSHLSQLQLQQLLLEIIKSARYSNNGYFWVNDFSYKMIMHPIKSEYDGKIFINTPRVPFVELGVNALNDNKKQAFIEYKFYNPATKKYEFKVSLVRVFKPYNWIIGTGRYISDVTKFVQKQVIQDIKSLRYGKNGYFWINNMNYKMIMHPIKPEYDGKIFINTPKVPFVKLGVDIIKSGKTQGFIEYKFYNPATKKYERKLSFVRLFSPWNWILGTGTYLNDVKKIDEDIQKSYFKVYKELIKKVVFISLIILFLAVSMGYYLTIIWIINPMKELDNSKRYYEEIATKDYLTKIMNRRSFFENSKKMIEVAREANISFCAIMIDIDFFKKINDTYGHEAGDEVLKKVTSKISSIIRSEDIFGRIGGEEFAILMLHCNKDNLTKITEKIRREIDNCVVKYEHKKIRCTISMGGYIVKDNENNLDLILKKADELLYKAKHNGRNRVEIG